MSYGETGGLADYTCKEELPICVGFVPFMSWGKCMKSAAAGVAVAR